MVIACGAIVYVSYQYYLSIGKDLDDELTSPEDSPLMSGDTWSSTRSIPNCNDAISTRSNPISAYGSTRADV